VTPIASLLAPLVVLTAAAAPAQALRFTVNRVAATVNGDVITLRELERTAGSALERANLMSPGPDRDRARAEALRAAFELLLADRLFAQQVKKLDLQIGDAQVDAQVDAIREQNGFTDAELDQALEAQGMTREAFRERVRGQLQNFAVLQSKVGGRVKVTDQELQNYYRSHPQDFQGEDELRVRHILLPVPEGAAPAEVRRVQAEGERVLARLRAGEDFAKVAREVSKGPTADTGGDLGWLKRGTFQKALEDAAFALAPGQTSSLVRAGPGFHILHAVERRRANARAFEDVKELIRDRLIGEQAERYREQYVTELRREAVIDVRIPELQPQ
jgi:peptidyl-prolyl cis-trans isomerase SurA